MCRQRKRRNIREIYEQRVKIYKSEMQRTKLIGKDLSYLIKELKANKN